MKKVPIPLVREGSVDEALSSFAVVTSVGVIFLQGSVHQGT